MAEEKSGGSVYGAQLLGAGLSYGTDLASTRRQRKWQLADYERQKADAREFWDITNRYNSPEEQMNRLRQAGLNPNLVYGKGADVTAQALSGPTMDNAPRANFKLDPNMIAQAKMMNQQLKFQSVQTDNVLADTANKETENALKQAQINQTNVQTANIAQNTATSEFQLQQSQELKDSVLQKAKLENQALDTKNVVTLGEFELAKIKSASDKARAIQDIAESKSRVLMAKMQNARAEQLQPSVLEKMQADIRSLNAIINNHNLDADIKRFEADMRRQGTSIHDNSIMRKLWMFLSEDSKQTGTEYQRWKKLTYGGRPGFDAEGNPTSLYNMLTR